MTDLLQGYYWDSRVHNYVRAKTGRFVARRHIIDLLERSIAQREQRMAASVTALAEGRISPNVFVARNEMLLKRQYLQERALARGGWDRLTAADREQISANLKPEFERLRKLALELQSGEASVAQGVNRIHMYLGHARAQFFEVERQEQPEPGPGMIRVERRILMPGRNCADCIRYYELGWQVEGTLPLPTQSSACDGNCRCRLERKEISWDELGAVEGTKT